MLIHCITSPIAINDCANAVLALGHQPIMAEHPLEVADITRSAAALSVSLANITDARAKSMMLSGAAALEKGIPSVIDLVGITCSSYRKTLADEFVNHYHPTVIKGNISEIKSFIGCPSNAIGIDAGVSDQLHTEDDEQLLRTALLFQQSAKKYHTVLLATGAIDLIVDETHAYAISNGSPVMSKITGTGCILTCMLAACLSETPDTPLEAAKKAALLLGISGELADSSHGLGTYHIDLLNQLSLLTESTILTNQKIRQLL